MVDNWDQLEVNNLLYMSLFLRYKFLCFIQNFNLWVLIFVGVIFFMVMKRVHMVLLILSLGVITSLRRYERLVTKRKREFFDSCAISVMKERNS